MKLKQHQPVLMTGLVISLTSSLLVACGSGFKMDAVDDSMAYRSASKSVKALAIPPGLSTPDFDPTYAVNAQEELVGRQVKLIKLANGDPAITTTEAAGQVWNRLAEIFPDANLRIKDKDIEQGFYTVLYASGDNSLIPRKGWLNRALGLEKESATQEGDELYTVKVGRQGDTTVVVMIPDKTGNVATAQKLLNELKLELEL